MSSTLLPNTIIISLVLIGLLVIIEELMVVGRMSRGAYSHSCILLYEKPPNREAFSFIGRFSYAALE